MPSLDDVRRAIDGVDDAILELLEKRIALVDGVIAAKASEPQSNASPLRPGREMQILRRLMGLRQQADPQLLVRLWRTIVTEATLKQGTITIHVGRKTAQAMGHRLRIRDHFGRFPVEEWRDADQAMVQVNANPGDICIVETESDWAEPFVAGQAGRAQVIAALPAVKDAELPRLLVIGVAPAQATGEDETLMISKGNLPRDFSPQPLWQLKSGSYRVSALAGWYSEHETPLVGLARSNPGLGLKVAGRYASAIEV
jgi:chorismate mutase / prephenate dehydratase